MQRGEPITFEHKELLALMLRDKGIHEGLWMLHVEFSLNAGNFGPTEDQAVPGGFVGINRIGVIPVTAAVPSSLVLDAATVNPAPATSAKRIRRTFKKPAPE